MSYLFNTLQRSLSPIQCILAHVLIYRQDMDIPPHYFRLVEYSILLRRRFRRPDNDDGKCCTGTIKTIFLHHLLYMVFV